MSAFSSMIDELARCVHRKHLLIQSFSVKEEPSNFEGVYPTLEITFKFDVACIPYRLRQLLTYLKENGR